MSKEGFTHKGWFFMCPIYLNPEEGDGMMVDARWSWLEWWFDVNEFIFASMVYVKTYLDPDYEPKFPFLVTGKLENNNDTA